MKPTALQWCLSIPLTLAGSCSSCHEKRTTAMNSDKFLELRASADQQHITEAPSDPRIGRWRAECSQYLSCFVLRDLDDVKAIIGQPSRTMQIDDERQLLEFQASNGATFSLYVKHATVRGVFADGLNVLSHHVGISSRE